MTPNLNRSIVISLMLGFLILWASDYDATNLDTPRINEELTHADRMIGGSRNIEEVSRCLWGPAQCVYVNNNLAYIGAGGALVIVDISNPAAPDTVGAVYTPGIFQGIDYKRGVVYVADGTAGIVSINVSNPYQPQILDILNVEGYVEEIDIQGNYAYLAAGNGGLKIIDISNPLNLVQIDSLELGGYCHDIMMQGDYAYICGGQGGYLHWWIVDVSQPSVVYHYQEGVSIYEPFTGIYIADTLLYLVNRCYTETNDFSLLHIYDVSDPSNPVSMSSLSYINGWAHDIQVKTFYRNNLYRTYAYIADELHGLTIIDVTNPINPVEITSFLMPGFEEITCIGKLFVQGKYVYGAGEWLWIINVARPSSPTLLGYFDTGSLVSEIWGPGELVPPADDICGVANYYDGLQLVNVTSPTSPVPSGKIRFPGHWCRDVQLSANYAYLTLSPYAYLPEWPYLKICNIQNPAMPFETGSLLTSTGLTYLYYSGNYVYANGSRYFRIIDVSNPAYPRITGYYDFLSYIIGQEVFVVDSIAYTLYKPSSFPRGLVIFSISNPYQPQVMGYCDISGVGNALFVANGYAYVSANAPVVGTQLLVIDIQNPYNPHIVAELNLGFYYATHGCYVYGDYCYVTDWDALRIIDVSDPLNPVLVDSYYTPDPANDVWCARGYIYLTINRCGLYILRYNPTKNR